MNIDQSYIMCVKLREREKERCQILKFKIRDDIDTLIN